MEESVLLAPLDTPSPLHHAAEIGDLSTLSDLLAEGADPNLPDADEHTPLMLAAKNGHEETVRALLKWGADVNQPGPRNRTALVDAVRGGHAGIIRLLLARGASTTIYRAPEPHTPPPPEEQERFLRLMQLSSEADNERDAADTSGGLFDDIDFEWDKAREEAAALVNEQKPTRVNLLNQAISSDKPEALRALLEAGLDPNERIPRFGNDDTPHPGPIDWAIILDKPDMLRVLIDSGADPNGQDIVSPLMNVVMGGKLLLAQLLLDAGADPNGRVDGMPPLAFAMARDQADLVALLIKHGATLTGEEGTVAEVMSIQDPKMRAALNLGRGADWHGLVTSGDLDGVRAALEAGADVDARGDVENTALMLGAQIGHGPLVQLLLERGADATATNRYGWSLMHFAATGGTDDSADIVRALAARGASPDAPDQWGATPLWVAGLRRTPGVTDALREAGATVGIVEAALIGDADAVRGFVEAGVLADAPSGNGMTALMASAAQGETDLCHYLIARGADVNARQKAEGEMPLHWAARRGHTDAVRVLLDAGAEINARGDKDTPLLGAAQNGKIDVVRLLLERGASAAEPDEKAKSPVDGLIHAVLWAEADFHKRPEPLALPLLLAFGADPNARNNDGLTPLAVIWEKGFPQPFADLFLSNGADMNFTVRGKTWLLRAVEADDEPLARRLLDLGADPNRGNRWFNPLDVAEVRGNESVAALLRERGGALSTRPQESGVSDEERAELLKSFTYDQSSSQSAFGKATSDLFGKTAEGVSASEGEL